MQRNDLARNQRFRKSLQTSQIASLTPTSIRTWPIRIPRDWATPAPRKGPNDTKNARLSVENVPNASEEHSNARLTRNESAPSLPFTGRPVSALAVALFLLSFASPAWADGLSQEQEQTPKAEQGQQKEPSKLFRAMGWGVYGSSGADLISTEIALSRGAYEGNPFMRNRPVRISYHIALPIFFNWVTEKDRKNGHEKRALWMRIAFVAAYGYVTAHNLRQGVEP